MGLGLLGRGVGDVEFLAKCGAQVLVTDRKTEAELAESVEKLKSYPNVVFHLGAHDEKDFTGCDMVLKAAGVPLDSPYIEAARAAGVPVYMSTALFAKYAMEEGATIVGVTGTRGKSTTTQMIYEVLKGDDKRNVLLGGNIRGVSTLALLPEVEKGGIVVLELDSWQLQGFGDLKISPQIAVFTNLMQDHQNYYPNMDAYFSDKANIFNDQKEGDTLICGTSIEERIAAARPKVAPHVPPPLPSDWTLEIPGEHNRENASLAAEALRALHVTENEIRAGLEAFEAVTGRLQFLREINGVKIYNDNNATTPDATIAALKALDTGKKNIVLIMGGDDKKLDMSQLVSEIPLHCSKVVLFKERGTDRIRDAVFDSKNAGIEVYEEEGLENTVNRAFTVAASGEIILYSPAFSSFGKYFKNEFDRGDQFMKLVEKMN